MTDEIIIDENGAEIGGCNCDDPARVEPCPVHDSETLENKHALYPTEVEVTSRDRANVSGLTEWRGFDFKCAQCGNASIMHWFKWCPECGAKINWMFDKTPIHNFISKLRGEQNG